MPIARRSIEQKAADEAKAAAQGFRSEFVGVSWERQFCRWEACICHAGVQEHLGGFGDVQQAARAYDDAARRLRAKGEAHGGRAGQRWLRLNFPTAAEKAFAQDAEMPPPRRGGR